jgi:hypothetical protein
VSQITSVAINAATGWTRIDSLASHTYIEVSHWDASADASVGLRISGSDPGAGTAWNASGSRKVQPGGEWCMRLATTDQVWARSSAGTPSLDVSEAL